MSNMLTTLFAALTPIERAAQCMCLVVGLLAPIATGLASEGEAGTAIYKTLISNENPSDKSFDKPKVLTLVIDIGNGLVHCGASVGLELVDCQTQGWYCVSDDYIEFGDIVLRQFQLFAR